MKIYHEMLRESPRPLSLAIGFFDGMHAGHEEIARRTRRMRKPGWRSGVLSFSNHPAAYLRPGKEPPMICTAQERIDLFARAGFEECFIPPFDERIATLPPEAFMDALIRDLHVGAVSVGATFGFGHRRSGDVSLMAAYLGERDVRFEAVENVVADGARISSTRIRDLIRDGDLETADRLLGHPYELRGIVEIGFGRGHDLGFPTANLRLPEKLLPKDGVYACVARHDGRDYPSLVSIGTNPQFDGRARTVEVWLRDFNQTIYGHELALRDLRYVREQLSFESVDELVAQMQRDLEAVAFPAYG